MCHLAVLHCPDFWSNIILVVSMEGLFGMRLTFFKRFYLFIHETHTHTHTHREREVERERQRYRQREKQAPCREPDMGLDPESSGSRPGLKAVLNR